MKRIKLTQNRNTILDNDDYEELKHYSWHAKRAACNCVYAARGFRLSKGKTRMILMHREIMKVISTPEIRIDHIDGDGLNNCKSNLRIATPAQNMANQKLKSTNTSGYKGVSPRQTKTGIKWRAKITVQGRTFYLGVFESAIEAALKYDEAARSRWGEFARINFETRDKKMRSLENTYLPNLSAEERERFRRLLRFYFPELGTDEEMSGADVVQELCRIYEELSK